jgi:succinyl-CoA synthetase beta subunit
LKIHEYQAHEVLAAFGVPVPEGLLARSVQEVLQAAGKIAGEAWAIKAQIHAGGRGKAGGVRLCRGLEELKRAAERILGMRLVSPQTGPEGRVVRKVLVTEVSSIAEQFYAGIVLDRALALPVLMASAEGGVEIEEVAARSPEKIFKEAFSPVAGLHLHQGRKLARQLGIPSPHVSAAASLLRGLSQAFLQTDASLAEINPLVLTKDGRLVALDAKLSFDDNALFRHPELKAYRDLDEEEPQEVRAGQFDLSYIKMDGNIGCLVNGAGLAMATLDLIQHWGGQPANFLDVGGGATTEKVTEAFKIILDDPRVKAILVNIFGGIMKCDVIASGILGALKSVHLRWPLVVRLEGTNVEQGKKILESSGVNVILADGLSEAARKVVEVSGGKAA